MATLPQIVQFAQQPSPLVRGLGAVAQGAQAIGDARRRQAQKTAYEKASLAFLDTTDDDTTDKLLREAIDADPKTAYSLISSITTGSNIGAAEAAFNRQIAGLSPEDQKRAVEIKLGLRPRAVGSASQTIAESDRTSMVADSQAEIEGRKSESREEGKARGRASVAPLIAKTESSIQAAIQQEKASAKSKGEAESELKTAKAALPSLKVVVEDLKKLAPVATNTYSGRAFDAVAREVGFGATEGAEARAKFIAIIDNQVLPLLKQTFGAAFTVQEGENLKRTMGDPNASPEEKIAQLNAFIDNKVREIEVKERELGVANEEEPAAKTFTSPSGITFTVE